MFKFRSGPGDHPIQRAVFEFLVIVTGVLVALAVDEWRQERAEIRELNQHLISLLDEVESNLESITYIRVSLTQVKIPGLETVIAHLESGETTVDDADEFLKAFADSTLLAVPWFERNRFDALKNSGSLRMLHPETAGQISGTFEEPEILLPQVVQLQGGYPVFAQQFIPADDQSELNSLRYYLEDTAAPEFVFDISADEAIDLIHENRDELLLLARGEAAAVTAKWYALKRLEIEFSALKELLESQIVAHQG